MTEEPVIIKAGIPIITDTQCENATNIRCVTGTSEYEGWDRIAMSVWKKFLSSLLQSLHFLWIIYMLI